MDLNYSLAERIFVGDFAKSSNRKFYQVAIEARRAWRMLPEQEKRPYVRQAHEELGGPSSLPSRNSRSVSLEEAHNQALSWNKRLEENYIMAMKQIDSLYCKIRNLKTELEKERDETAQEKKMNAEIKEDEAQFYYDLYEDLLAQHRAGSLVRQAEVDDLRSIIHFKPSSNQNNEE